jgi:hypothetical protein
MRVHRNLNRACWSVTVRGEPVRHVDAFALSGVRFIVSAAGRARVLTRNVRAVHAWADGEACDIPTDTGALVPVSYNPYRSGAFLRRDNGAPVHSAHLVVFTTDGQCLVSLD